MRRPEGRSYPMVTNGVTLKEARSSERVALQCSIIIANGVQTADGQVLNVSKYGCLVEAAIRIKPGDHLQLRLFLPDGDQSMCVCRWQSYIGSQASDLASSF